ncbi:hypothetical protein ACFTAO_15895 [Paenibacillus rhizoplanae]
MNGPGQQPTPDNKLLKLIKDETGITFNQEFLVGDLQQKLGVMIAGGDYPGHPVGRRQINQRQGIHSA